MKVSDRIWLWWNGYCTKHIVQKTPAGCDENNTPTCKLCPECDEEDALRWEKRKSAILARVRIK